MSLLKIRPGVSTVYTFAVLVLAALLSGSCGDLIYDGEGDCSPRYRVPFRFTKNMLDADAFGSQVTEVNLYLFDSDGNLAFSKRETRELTTENNYYMDVEVRPGTYDIIAWCMGRSVIDGAVSFETGAGQSANRIEECGASLPLDEESDGLFSRRDINRLYYGISEGVEFVDFYGEIVVEPVCLTKDTNHITVQIQNIDGGEIPPDLFSFTLEGANSELDSRNNLCGDVKFTYKPWSIRSLSMETGGKSEGVACGVQVEFTTGRIMANVEQMLSAARKDTGEKIFEIPLVKYLLLVRGMYEEATSNQDYLDRYDDFSLVFFVTDDMSWVKTKVLINGWRVVPPQNDIL